MTADPKSLQERLSSWLPPAGVTLEREDYDLFIEAATALDAQAALLEEARRAMKPFADFIEKYEHNGGSVKSPSITEFRAIRAFLAKTEPT